MPATSRNIVIVRAGDASLHPGWTSTPAARDWDLAVSYYGRDPALYGDRGDRRFDDPGPKFPGLHALLTREPFWRAYDYIWLPDDDLAVEQAAVSRMFAVMDELGLDLAQPSLSWTSYYSFALTLRRPSFLARFTNLIEIMAPCFSRAALETCLSTFAPVQSGWGLSWVWPALLGVDQRRCAIIDAVEITHTRPVGGPEYPWLAEKGMNALDERLATLRRYGLEDSPRAAIDAAVTSDGRRLDPRFVDQCVEVERLLRADREAFKAATGSDPHLRSS